MARTGTTAVLALVPDAALLYPWLPADEVGEPELRRLRSALPGPIPVRLSEVARTGGFVGVPVPGLSQVADSVRTAFPAQVPYGGRFGPRPPVHVTVALDVTPGAAAVIARRTAAVLPITTVISALHVVGLTPAGWRGLAELPLGHQQ
ncbi:hypothetical protein RVN83_01485 [Streptomyces sp. PU10]|uniref:hypothetical protein n=1 Tax=Streptomyces sp. PU10 TaxID=3062780 RepID=UPI0028FC3812|nr:hypothetical protein [Streptomyces sp. PU10]MDU0251989.1 hypothetical protein [Streptomyces sp. PU10]